MITRRTRQIIYILVLITALILTLMYLGMNGPQPPAVGPVNQLRLDVNPTHQRITSQWPLNEAVWTDILDASGALDVVIVDLDGTILLGKGDTQTAEDGWLMESLYMDDGYQRAHPHTDKITLPVVIDGRITALVVYQRQRPDPPAVFPWRNVLGILTALCWLAIVLMGAHALFTRRNPDLEALRHQLDQMLKGHYTPLPPSRDRIFQPVFDQCNLLSDEIQDILRRQHTTDHQRKQFLTMVSHELKTPIATIDAYVEGLAANVAQDEAQRQRYIQVIHDKMQQLKSQVDEFFRLAQRDAGVFKYQMEEVYADQVIGEILQSLKAPDGIQQHVADQLPACIVAMDTVRIQQVITNLHNNACKHTPDGGTITLRTYREDQQVVVEVEDNGRGIAPADLPHIFDAYYQGQDARAADYEGIGLGLAICKEIVEHHGGQIQVRSRMDEGTMMRVMLPVV